MQRPQRRISRRSLMRGAAALPVAALAAACGGPTFQEISDAETQIVAATELAAAPPTPEPEPPFVVPAGEEVRQLMPATPWETPLYVFGSGLAGPIVMVLGGVHGNEPGGWEAAEEVVDSVRPSSGALLVIPRANRVATRLFERTTDEMGDLNRMYPGDPNGQPMARMAHEIVEVLRAYRATVVLDLHESWGFYNERTQNGTAFLGQTVSASAEPGITLARNVVESVNTRILYSHEEMFFREWGGQRSSTAAANPGITQGSRSSLGLYTHVPGASAILVEMGQQQELRRRVALHVDFVKETLHQLGAA
jgi:uncharacterized protein